MNVYETYFKYEWTTVGFVGVMETRDMTKKRTKQEQADYDFRDSMAKILADPKVLASVSEERQAYVLYAHDSMSWWIDGGEAGKAPWPESGVPVRNQVILVWSGREGSTVSLRQASTAIEAQDNRC